MLRRRRPPVRASSTYVPSQEAPTGRQALVFGGLATLVLGGAVGLYLAFEGPRRAGLPSDEGPPRTLGLSGIRYDTRDRAIEGQVRNYTDVPYTGVTVTFEVLAADRRVLATVRDSAATVDVGETWRFEIPVRVDSVARVRLVRYAGARQGGPRRDVEVMREVALR